METPGSIGGFEGWVVKDGPFSQRGAALAEIMPLLAAPKRQVLRTGKDQKSWCSQSPTLPTTDCVAYLAVRWVIGDVRDVGDVDMDLVSLHLVLAP